ncbi:efflux transporter outer membrane subunit [Sphingobium cupriresistens]|uniref:Efflux transporter outer membrane subunit n=2 Tax=Sphingobium TaxID=165695 RepID=A0A8G1ZGW5_9SPHN|nr:efflux transporter outer membrane subunit [Sphingobium cupriresistens]RYM11514.1 efflux transporter outer membrane subunit [Sphingobium cupriresistens]WCP13706.1 Outer membrane protein OprM [Sphingobium sp. AntQ-1]
MKRHCMALAGAATLLSGCMPADVRPPASATVVAPAAWRDAVAAAGSIAPDWWRAFGDPVLDRLIEDALARNTDILVAAARVQEAQADIRTARSALLPAVDAIGAGQYARAPGASGLSTSTALQPELQANWQVDLFGRLSRLTDAARLRYVASQADRDAMALSVAAQVAQGYIGLLALDAQLFVSQETVTSRKEALRLATDQASVGYISQFELTQAQSEYQAVEQAIPQIRLALSAQENALRRLVGDLPGPVARHRSLIDFPVPVVPATLPSDLLRRRPDIASAELAIAAADARLAADRAAFLPQVALSASLGQLLVNATDYDPVTIWSLGGSILAPIFSGGRLTAQVATATAQRDQAAFAYRGAALAAFEEVETALTGVLRYAEQIDRLHNRRTILKRSVALATDRYRGGYAAYIEQLDAQRNLYATELDAISVRQLQLENIITLYRALGGGWSGGQTGGG